MRVLHTADWHLGQRLYGLDRTQEHQCFLDWLLTTIADRQVEALVIAGDVFDTGAPPAAAQQQYYSFLVELSRQQVCRDVIVIGGNHDSAAMLNAAAPILKTLRVHVVGGAPARDEDQCIVLPSEGTTPRLVVAAVPFLRDADVRRAVPGETPDARQERLRAGIHHHYQRVARCAAQWREAGVPVLATGHLFAAGAAESPSERPLTIGTLGQVTAATFPPEAFDYVALGHLHKPQVVGGTAHIRYSGAPVPLSFAEAAHDQQVLLLTFTGLGCPEIEALTVPCRRRLVRFSDSLDEVLSQLAVFERGPEEHVAWAEVRFVSADTNVACLERLREAARAAADHVLVLGTPRHDRPDAVDATDAVLEEVTRVPHLDDLTPTDVFHRLLDQQQYLPETEARTRLETTFAELLARRAAA